MPVPFIEENDQTVARREHLEALRTLVGNVYPNKFERSNVSGTVSGEDTITSIIEAFKRFEPRASEGEKPAADDLEAANSHLNKVRVRLAGRIAAPPRVMGKAAFVHLSDGTSRLQIYVRRQDVVGVRNDAAGGEANGWELFGLLDHGDFIAVEGYLFVTKTGELSVHVEKLQFLAKALLPMPDKMHGIHDPEIRQRQRYADLIAGSLKLERDNEDLTPREVFELRSKVVREIRRFLDEHGYIEVETPMLTPLATGAAARPFKTHHNALDIDLYARIAPELYLKRLVVGGFEKVYELNRNFRNEGISTKHNPEVHFSFPLASLLIGNSEFPFQGDWLYDAALVTTFVKTAERFARYEFENLKELDFREHEYLLKAASELPETREQVGTMSNLETHRINNVIWIFENWVEHYLINPTFITDFPKAISPLSKASPSDLSIAERFEFFVGALESANGFSELNDPEEQYQRFKDQVVQRERGDEEAMVMDEDYIRALSYGMPPAAGIGVGIDRLVMLLANKHSIRDVILFPHLRPEKAEGSKQ